MARKLPRYPSVPAAPIGWLGGDATFRGQHVGSMLLADAITRLAAAPIGLHAIGADAIDEAAAGFDDYWTRPIDLAQLYERLDRWPHRPDQAH